MGVSGAGCRDGLRKGGGTESGESWWKISGRRRKEKSLDVTGAALDNAGERGAGDRGAGERAKGVLVRGLATGPLLKRDAWVEMGEVMGALRLMSKLLPLMNSGIASAYSSTSSGPFVDDLGREAIFRKTLVKDILDSCLFLRRKTTW